MTVDTDGRPSGVNGYLHQYDHVKIGATTNPNARWNPGHQRDGWDKIVLIYKSDRAGSTRSMETKLIAYAKGTTVSVIIGVHFGYIICGSLKVVRFVLQQKHTLQTVYFHTCRDVSQR